MAARMHGEPVKVTSAVDGETVDAIKLKCLECGHDQFVALLIGAKRDLHLQCVECGNCHCTHDSECNRLTDTH